VRLKEEKVGILMMVPALCLLALIVLYPIVRSFHLSFTQRGEFVGLSNFVSILHDERFRDASLTTLLFFSISVPLELIFGIGAALLLQGKFRGRGIVRAAHLIPWALPTVVMAVAWKWIFNDAYGVFNDILVRLGIIHEPIAWLGLPGKAFFCIIVAEVWKCVPFVTIIVLVGLQSIPPELYEALSVDGAGYWQRFRLITLPLLRPAILVALIFRGIQALGVFDSIWVMTGGGPAGSTEPISLYIYSTVFRYLNIGYASSMVTVAFLFSLLFACIVYFVLTRRPVEY
jgi:multiple sugar transport system permease protein